MWSGPRHKSSRNRGSNVETHTKYDVQTISNKSTNTKYLIPDSRICDKLPSLATNTPIWIYIFIFINAQLISLDLKSHEGIQKCWLTWGTSYERRISDLRAQVDVPACSGMDDQLLILLRLHKETDLVISFQLEQCDFECCFPPLVP